MRRRTAWILAAGVAALALGAAAVGAVALLVRGGRPSGGWASGASYLALDLSKGMPEEPSSGLAGFFEARPASVRALVEAVDRAGRDAAVKGLVLRVGSVDAGWARVQELRDALLRFRRTGKPSWAHLESAGNIEYLLATGCAKVAASPTAMIDVSGLAAEVTFYRGTLDKLGIEAQFEGVGKYKNAPNQFTEKGFTEPHREQMEALVGSLFDQLVDGVAEARGLEAAAVRALVDRGPFTAEEAKEAGLVDELLYLDEVAERVPGAGGIDAARYVRAARGFGFDGRPKVALVYVDGDIMPGESASSPFGGGMAGSDTIVRGLRQAREDDSVRAIVLRVDSPGGSGTASDAVWREVALARRTKPVVASMGDYAASGGYYVAMGADAIVAQPGTITGSIGVFSGKMSLRRLYEKIGMSQETVQRGRHATIFSSWSPWTDEEREKVRRLNVAFYETFVAKAAEGRKKKPAEIEAVAQGRVWTGVQALEAGLVDSLGGLEAAVRVARERARIPKGQEVQLVVLPERKGLFETLMERQDEDVLARALGTEARSFLRWATALCGRGPIARVPYEVAVR
ncbi:MAG TPA: signal peptide peptidase SppA [Vicinamibacteria bacterium]